MRLSIRAGQMLALALAGSLVLGACGDSDDDAKEDKADTGTKSGNRSSEEAASSDAYCGATFALETVAEPEIDFETATPEEIATGVKAWATESMRPLADDAIAAAPDELSSDLAIVNTALGELESTGDFTVFEKPEASAASDRLHAHDLATCGWNTQAVTVKEYAFDLPDQLDAGITSFEVSNDGQEVHELLLVRKQDGVTESAEELLALPEDQAMAKLEMLGVPAVLDPGGSDYKVLDLAPGNYVAVCFIPVGTTTQQGLPGPSDAPPHFTQGMVAEFTVA